MARVADILAETGIEVDDAEFYSIQIGLILHWFNRAQEDLSVEGEELQKELSLVSVDGTLSYSLPSDFLRELVVKRGSDLTPVDRIKYEDGLVTSFAAGAVRAYSIFNGSFYLWPTGDGSTYTIPYIKKPASITVSNYKTANPDVSTQYDQAIVPYLLSRYWRVKGNKKLSNEFLAEYRVMRDETRRRSWFLKNPSPTLPSSWF